MKFLENHSTTGVKVRRIIKMFKQRCVLGPGHIFGVCWNDVNIAGLEAGVLNPEKEKQKWFPTQRMAHNLIRSLRKEVMTPTKELS